MKGLHSLIVVTLLTLMFIVNVDVSYCTLAFSLSFGILDLCSIYGRSNAMYHTV